MSHSQFHSTNLFILRHAWLNLWDKHMTTGRINQVTTFPKLLHRAAMCTKYSAGPRATFLQWEFISDLKDFDPLSSTRTVRTVATKCLLTARSKPPCSPISHHLDSLLLVCYNKNGGLWRELPATSKTACSLGRGGFPSVLIATSLAISKKSTFLTQCKQQQKNCVLDCVPTDLSRLGRKTIRLK